MTRTVLVVEDDPDIRHLLVHSFTREGFEVVPSADGAEALAYLEDHDPPDLIVLDLLMPDVGGLEFLRRRDGAHADIPVIVLTGLEDEDMLAEAYDLGANDYVTKPFSPRELATRATHLASA